LGTQNNGWTFGLTAGFWMLFFQIVFVGTGYICLCLCMAEMSSALPFSGGIFGFVRASTGPFCGYLVACTELLLNTVYVALMVAPIAKLPFFLGLMEEAREPVVIFAIYCFLLMICCLGGKPFWTMNALLGISSLVILLIYLLGTTGEIGSGLVSFNKYCSSHVPFTAANALGLRQAGAHQFLGVQYMPLASNNLKDPRTQLPRMMLLTIAILFCSAISLAFAACSQAPGIAELAARPYPLDIGFASLLHRSREAGAWLHLPGMLASAFGFFYSYGRQLFSIAKSGLLPRVLAETVPVLDTPYVAQCFGAVFCFGINLWMFYQPPMLLVFKNIATLSLLTVVLFAFAAFALFRIKYSTMQRHFTNPIGSVCVAYGVVNYGAGFVSIIFFRGNDFTPITTLLVYLSLAAVFYVVYMSKHQTFSEEEKKHLFKAYLINGKHSSDRLSLFAALMFFPRSQRICRPRRSCSRTTRWGSGVRPCPRPPTLRPRTDPTPGARPRPSPSPRSWRRNLLARAWARGTTRTRCLRGLWCWTDQTKPRSHPRPLSTPCPSQRIARSRMMAILSTPR
jgi:amino acid transporter